MKKQKKNIIHIIILALIALLFSGAIYLKNNFSTINFNEIMYSFKYGNDGMDYSIIFKSALKMLPAFILAFMILYMLFYDITFNKKKLIIKEKQIYPFSIKYKKLLTSIILIISICLVLHPLGLFDYVLSNTKNSTFIEENYINPRDVKVEFKEKRNLVFIFVESLETTMFTKDQGGYWDYELMPELYSLLNDEDSVVFYNKDKSQETNMIEGSSWTTASVVSNLSGTPLKVNLATTIYDKNSFMNNIYTLGDLLKDNGYYNEVISGARTSFGGLQQLFTAHGNYSIIDENTLDKYDLTMTEKDKGKWGFNDKYLFETAKKRLEVISKNKEPFNLELITIDTHFVDGFVGDYSETKYSQYENAYATESKLIYDFVSWLKKQDYYKDTTIVITGDHLTMQTSLFKGKNAKDRYVYNCIINPVDKNAKNEKRIITSLDNYPTIVYAIGGTIQNNRLGLGTNLFSNEKTLSEKYSFEKFSKELNKNSKYYNNKILSRE